ncbi:putative transcriptional regulator [Paenibacillus mucilaginosus 3016]|uniref:Putative transcriptional regulator n=1 Tax=Paenibacillus mucilaginosus 3016 TaxID=1116391 RepID=H6NNZ2_9BACL|nr:PLP-dependent aminotransferase family protein [Paenibacillus mucilaginosus]AFC31066.1 putative transcriptional regulator [Paenibacillus mucilaginosus 3016]WFA19651.1 PLP-dependent aminotransferase family protein [Paenibacillus mucilaginosus]
MWKPDRSSKTPMYLQIADYVERSISLGEYPPGSFLPSERRLAERIGVNRSTVVQAYEELRAKGIVESSVGSGTMVSREVWGIRPGLSPDWRHYVQGGTFARSLPYLRRIREVLQERPSIINMASGELSADLFPNEQIIQVMKEVPFEAHLGYDDPQGYYPLRETLSGFMRRELGIHTTESSILITSGSQQSLFLILQCLLAPGDAVAVEDPSYCGSLAMFQSAGIRTFPLPVREDGIDPRDVETLFKEHRIRMVFLNPNYQNPTGTTLHPDKRRPLLNLAAELGIPIVEDDPFSLTDFEGNPPPSLKSIDEHGTVLYIGSLSKIAASGLRIGWLIAPSTVVQRLADARQQIDFGLSIIPQWTANAFMRSGNFGEHLSFLQQALAHKQDLLIRSLERELGDEVRFTAARGGLSLWCGLRRPVDDLKLLEEAVKRGVVYTPGAVYGSVPGHIRLSFARPPASRIEEGIFGLAQALRFLQV